MAGLTFFLLVTMWATSRYVYLNEFRKYEVDYNVLVTNKIKSQFDFMTDIIRSTGNALGSNAKVLDLLSKPQSGSGKEIVERRNEISSLLLGIIGTQPFIKGAHIVSEHGNVYSSTLSIDEDQVFKFASRYFDILREKKMKELWTEVHEVEYYPDNYFNVMSYICPVYNMETQSLIGLISVDINYEIAREMFQTSSMALDEKIMVVDTEGNIIFNHPFLSNFEPVLDQYPQILTSKNLQLRGTVFGRDSIIVTETIEMADWKLVRMIDAMPLTERSRSLLFIFNTILLLAAIISFAFIFFSTQTIKKPVKTLIQACKRIERGDLDFRVSLKLKNELGILGDTFNIMMDQIQSYYQKEIDEQKRKSELEFQVLQAQINPHFLYNTLDAIVWMTETNNNDKVVEITKAFSSFFRITLSKGNEWITLAEEIEHTRSYLIIQRMRYRDILSYEIDVDDSILKCRILKLILQPIVENALYHGIKNKRNPGSIIVRASRYGDEKILLEVIDDGNGMTEERLREVVAHINADNSVSRKNEGYGLRNVNQRIKLYYGKQYGLSIKSEYKKGTHVSVIIPLVGDENV